MGGGQLVHQEENVVVVMVAVQKMFLKHKYILRVRASFFFKILCDVVVCQKFELLPVRLPAGVVVHGDKEVTNASISRFFLEKRMTPIDGFALGR